MARPTRRTIALTDPPMRGNDVRALQQATNSKFKHFKIRRHIAADGVAGPATIDAAKQIGHMMGTVGKNNRRAFRRDRIPGNVQRLIRGRKKRRNERLAAARRKPFRKALRKRYRRPASGTGRWGGSKSIVVNEAAPVARRYGAPKSSAKRGVKHWATIANPGSDHSVLATTAFAQDYATSNGDSLARSIAAALGITNYSTGNYNNHYITRAGKRFRVQILWAVSGHYDHVHVGIRRA